MPKLKKGLLQIPQGTEGIYLEEAFKHSRIVRSIEDLFIRWGYLPAKVPIFDFFDTYRDLIDERVADSIYRLIDRDGDLQMLRSDITLFLAKQVGLGLQEQDLPLRVSYADSILRHQDSEDISRNEFFQVGAEMIGLHGIRADAEILALLSEILLLLDMRDVYIHLGSRRLFDAASRKADTPVGKGERQSIVDGIETRDARALLEAWTAAGLEEEARWLTDLFLHIDEPRSLTEIIASVPETDGKCEEMRKELHHLSRLSSIIEQLFPGLPLRIDLSEIGSQAYYTGIVFQVYAAGADRAIASGGRYDELLGHFGNPIPSVGFSMFLRKAEPLIGRADRFSVPEAGYIENDDVLEALREAAEIRRNGGIAIL